MICAWIDTSSDATGSSQTSASGRIASARATATRWRWPPENWCGNRSRRCCVQPDRREPARDIALRFGLGDQSMRQRTLGNDVADAHARIERGERVLKHHLDARRVLAAGRHHGLAGKFSAHPCLASRMPAATRPSVDLPQPDSPTSPSVSPFAMAQRHVFDRMHHGRVRLRSGQALGQPLGERRHRREPTRDTGKIDEAASLRALMAHALGAVSAGSTIQRVVAAPDPAIRRMSQRAAYRRRWWHARSVP